MVHRHLGHGEVVQLRQHCEQPVHPGHVRRLRPPRAGLLHHLLGGVRGRARIQDGLGEHSRVFHLRGLHKRYCENPSRNGKCDTSIRSLQWQRFTLISVPRVHLQQLRRGYWRDNDGRVLRPGAEPGAGLHQDLQQADHRLRGPCRRRADGQWGRAKGSLPGLSAIALLIKNITI